MVIETSSKPFEKRAAEWDLTGLPVPADLLVYTKDEWHFRDKQARFYKTLAEEAVWLYEK